VECATVSDRPYVLLSCAVSIDGYIDDNSDRRLILSGDADLDRVDEVRAGCGAILVGAATIRRDDPRLLVRSRPRRRERQARGLPPSPVKVTLTSTGDLDPAARFFTAEAAATDHGTATDPEATATDHGTATEPDEAATDYGTATDPEATATDYGTATDPDEVATDHGTATDPEASAGAGAGARASRIVYVASAAADQTRGRLGPVADIVDAGDPIDLGRVLADLASRDIGRLMVEGGGSVLTQFLTAGLADELQLAVAPFFVGDSGAPRFVTDGSYPWSREHPARLADVSRLGDVVVLRYALSARFGGA
jgi:5-amino-6-(5-phosphoribosylamino)uracil reductase